MTEEIKNTTTQVTPQAEVKPVGVVTPAPELNEDGTPKVAVPTEAEKKAAEKKEKIAKIVAKVGKTKQTLQAKEKELTAKEQKIINSDEFKKLLETDPLKAIEKFGISKDKLYESIIKSGEVPTVEEKVAKLEAELEKTKAEREADRKALEDRDAQMAIQAHKAKINEYATSKKDSDMKITVALGQTDAIYNVIEQEFNTTGRLMPIEEAGKLVEDYFSNQGKKEYERLKAIFEPEVKPEPKEDSVTSPASKTLTNKSTTIPSAEVKPRTKEEINKYLIEKYKDKLWT